MDTKKYITVTIPSNIELITPLRLFIRNLLETENWNYENIENVEIGFDETITNVIRHTYSYNLDHKIEIEISSTKKEIVIDIKDNGKPFNPTQIILPPIKEQIKSPQTRFFGTSLMRKCIDKIEYLSTAEFTNISRLTKYNH